MQATESMDVAPGPRSGTVRTASGEIRSVPAGWELLPPGDAGLTRKLKSLGPTWTVKQKKGRRVMSSGVWADAQQIRIARQQTEARRSDPSYAKKLASDRNRRERVQAAYVDEFREGVRAFLNFAATHVELADAMSDAITRHATPVGSGTVARTSRIPIERRVESAVIAWMRHQTTAYDSMQIERRKGRRREVRRELAAVSHKLLDRYRNGVIPNERCPLARWFEEASQTAAV